MKYSKIIIGLTFLFLLKGVSLSAMEKEGNSVLSLMVPMGGEEIMVNVILNKNDPNKFTRCVYGSNGEIDPDKNSIIKRLKGTNGEDIFEIDTVSSNGFNKRFIRIKKGNGICSYYANCIKRCYSSLVRNTKGSCGRILCEEVKPLQQKMSEKESKNRFEFFNAIFSHLDKSRS